MQNTALFAKMVFMRLRQRTFSKLRFVCLVKRFNKNHSHFELRQESHLCTSGQFSGPGKSIVEDSWEICASKDLSLSLLTPVLDLTWDVEIPAHTSLEGSIDAFGEVIGKGEDEKAGKY